MKYKDKNNEWKDIRIKNYGIEHTPIGSMIYYPSQTIPKGYLVCDGTRYLISDYPELFKAIGYIGGEDIEEGYFKVPDMRGNVPAGYHEGLDSNNPLAGKFGDKVGESTHTLTEAQMPAHNHYISYPNDTGPYSAELFQVAASSMKNTWGAVMTTTQRAGGGEAHPNVQPSMLYHWLIKARNMVTLGGYTEDFNVDGSLNVKGDLKFNDVHLNDLMNDIVGDTVPIGAVMEWDNDTIPDNWLLLDGRAVSRTDYSELFQLYGTRYGAGDGSTTFNLPNRKTRVSVGKDNSDSDFNTLGKTGGEKTHQLEYNEMSRNCAVLYDSGLQDEMWCAGEIKNYPQGAYKLTYDGAGFKRGPHNNLQPYFVTNFIVKAKQSAGVVATVVDNLNSTSDKDALSANQGRVLNEKLQRHIMTTYHSGANSQSINVESTYTGYPVEFGSYNRVGDKLSLSDNKIVIGAGVKKVLISGMLAINRGTTSTMVYMLILKNNDHVAYTSANFTDWMQTNVVANDALIEVNEGDKISMQFGTGDGTGTYQIRRGINLTRMTVQVVE